MQFSKCIRIVNSTPCSLAVWTLDSMAQSCILFKKAQFTLHSARFCAMSKFFFHDCSSAAADFDKKLPFSCPPQFTYINIKPGWLKSGSADHATKKRQKVWIETSVQYHTQEKDRVKNNK